MPCCPSPCVDAMNKAQGLLIDDGGNLYECPICKGSLCGHDQEYYKNLLNFEWLYENGPFPRVVCELETFTRLNGEIVDRFTFSEYPSRIGSETIIKEFVR